MRYDKYFPIIEYYKNFVIPLNPRRYHLKGEKMMVCPLHDDHDPSLGIINTKDRGEIFHCLGCNQWGTVVVLHQRVCKRLLGRFMTEDEALKDLCRLFNVDYDKLPKPKASQNYDKDTRQEMDLMDSMKRFDVSDYRQMFLQGKMSKKGIGYFNTLTMIMVNELKEE